MNKEKIIALLEKRKKTLKEKGVERIGLFGSYLKGKQKRGSDIDLLIKLHKNTAGSYFGLWEYLENVFNKKIDLIIESDLKEELLYVKKEAYYVTL